MKRGGTVAVAALAVFAVGLAGSWAGAEAAGRSRSPQKRSVADIRNVGTAMMAWLTDNTAAAVPGALDIVPAADSAPAPVDWKSCPVIPYAELTAMLSPIYIQEVPRRDGWGHDFQFCLERQDLLRDAYLIGVRSPGKDGVFETGTYAPGAFEPEDVDRDIVWLDGFFVRWPASEPSA